MAKTIWKSVLNTQNMSIRTSLDFKNKIAFIVSHKYNWVHKLQIKKTTPQNQPKEQKKTQTNKQTNITQKTKLKIYTIEIVHMKNF